MKHIDEALMNMNSNEVPGNSATDSEEVYISPDDVAFLRDMNKTKKVVDIHSPEFIRET